MKIILKSNLEKEKQPKITNRARNEQTQEMMFYRSIQPFSAGG